MMFAATRTLIEKGPRFRSVAEATTAACMLEIACWMKACAFGPESAAETVEALALDVESAVLAGGGTLIVLTSDGRRVELTVSADDAKLSAALAAAERAGLAILGINPAAIAGIIKESGRYAHASTVQ